MEALAAAAAATRNNIHAWLHTQSSTGTHHPPFVFFFFPYTNGPLVLSVAMDILPRNAALQWHDGWCVGCLGNVKGFTSLWKHWIWSFIVLPECASFRIKKSCLKILDFKLYFNNFRSFSVLILKNNKIIIEALTIIK